MKILLESITYIHVGPPREDPRRSDHFHVRVWREEPDQSYESMCSSRAEVEHYGHNAIRAECRELNPGRSVILAQLHLAKQLLKVPRVNAVEVKDGPGAGVVLYKDWP